MWTEQQIVNLLNTNDRAVERAVLAIYERQTADEKQTRQTKHDNTVGFRQNHAPKMSQFARYLKAGGHLYPAQLELARKWMKMYRRQLCEIANSRALHNTSLSPAEVNRQEDERERRKANHLG
jgi:hypothetical protein